MDNYQNFIATSRYTRWLEEENRRETWDETVNRYVDNMINKYPKLFRTSNSLSYITPKIANYIKTLKVMPSMRALMTSGKALDKCNVAGYNCSYLVVDDLRAFDEAMYILMCGTGVGFSVERYNVDKIPAINEHFEKSNTVIKVADSRSGWARALRELLAMLSVGQIPTLDVEAVRPAGARLKTFGGRASGPAPLIDLYKFCVRVFKNARGRRLYPIECHDIMCKIGEVVVVGGVRRSALISLSNLNDDQMRHAKAGQWWETDGHRALSNNSVAYKSKPQMETFMREWLSLVESKSGERGIFNRSSALKQAGKSGRRDTAHEFGCNPCSEIILRPSQFCNLTEVVVRSDDTIEMIKDKIKIATILGTYQSTLTDFKYLRKIWQHNTVEERLLGVSLTGIMDNVSMYNLKTVPKLLEELKQTAVETNKIWAEKFGINQSTAITCVKPSGTVSQLVDSASGIHPRHSKYYIRTVRADNKDPLTQLMKDEGIPNEPDITKPDSTTVFSFPMKAPKGAITRNELSAIEHLEIWKVYQEHWCEHKPSVTITVRDNEWLDVGAWVYKNFDDISGISFLPHSDHTYAQAPYQEISKEEYTKFLKAMPTSDIDWSKLSNYEKDDNTTGHKELACTAGVCEVVDLERS
tara:strand:- start:9207 stop:11123 length:1917 start_codon:yes stop_codon:yes gene_type:complete